MTYAVRSEVSRAVVSLDGVARVAFNGDGSMELLTPPSAAPDANDVPTFGTSLVRGTAKNTTSGTAIDFTGIPSWAKRVTVMLNGVSTNGASLVQVQVGAGGVQSSGYVGHSARSGGTTSTFSTGFIVSEDNGAAFFRYGSICLVNVSGTVWACTSITSPTGASSPTVAAGGVTISGPLDRIRLTTVNGTDTFDAGSVNIMWE